MRRYVSLDAILLTILMNFQLKQADLIVSELGTDPQVISAAIGLVAAEQNFNPFVVSIPTICNDPTLPTTVALRGVVPLVDPAVGDSDVENANSATSKTSPFSNAGLSVAQVMVAQGFSNFTAVAVDGTKEAASSLGGASSGSVAVSSVATSDVAAVSTAAAVASGSAVACGGTTLITVTRAVSRPISSIRV